MSAFTAREAALGAFSGAQSMGRGRVLGADPNETNAARRMTWERVAALVRKARGTPRVLAGEPDDARLDWMANSAQERIDELVEREDARVDAQRTRGKGDVDWDHGGRGVGPRRWLQPDGTFR